MNSSVKPAPSLIERIPQDISSKKLQEQGLSPILSRLFSARGVQDINEVRAGLSEIEPVANLKNAVEMGKLLADCVQDKSRVLIISDYDCDGATACAVLIKAFQGAKMNFDYMVPDRFKHGYGLTPSIVDEAALLDPKPTYIITVDNGISSSAGVERARELGIEVLVTDHHLCPKELPKAKLIVNPQQPGDTFGSKSVAGCGVAWYVAVALFDELKARKMECTFRPADLLPFVALGTVADVVQLDFNNRILVREGLEMVRRGECSLGIQELAEIANKPLDALNCQDFGFAIGPRINAAGRLANMSAGVECLVTKDRGRALALAEQLQGINEERKALQKQISAEADALTKIQHSVGERSSIVVYEPQWHEGVVGIVAGRMKDEHHRPTFVLTNESSGEIKGSGRSIDGFHLKHALDQIASIDPGILIRFGGHAAAAGITIHADKLEAFRTVFEQVCKDTLTPEMLTPKLSHDGALPEYAYNELAIHEMQREVWGQGFPAPMFIDRFPVANAKTMGSDGSHLKITVKRGNLIHDMVAFGQGACIDRLPADIEVAFTPSLNIWNNRVSIQLMSSALLNVHAPELELEMAGSTAPRVRP